MNSQWNERKNAKALSLAAWLLLALMAIFIFSNVQGALTYEGDDYLQTKFNVFHPTQLLNYTGNAEARAYLWMAYKIIYLALGQSLDNCVLFFIGLYILSAAFFYMTLSRVFSQTVALCGALLYLSYSMKYHAIIAYNAQLYIVVISLFIGILWIVTSRLRIEWQALLVSTLLLVSYHLYEVLIVTLPLYPVVWLGPAIFNKKMPSAKQCLWCLLPFLVTANHIRILLLNHNPIWNRDAASDHAKVKLIDKITSLWPHGIDQTFGYFHLKQVHMALSNFVHYDVIEAPWMLAFWLVLLVLSLWIVKHASPENQTPVSKSKVFWRKIFFWFGLYLAIVSPMLALPETYIEVPSRLLYLPSVGTAMFLAAALSYAQRKTVFKIGLSLLLIASLCEAASFANIIRAYAIARQHDLTIIRQIQGIPHLSLGPDDEEFISMPNSRKLHRYRRYGQANFAEGAGYVYIWDAYQLPPFNIRYSDRLRSFDSTEVLGLYDWAFDKSKTHKRLFPFYLDDNYQLHPITQITLLDNNNKVIKVIHTALEPLVPSAQGIRYTLRPENHA